MKSGWSNITDVITDVKDNIIGKSYRNIDTMDKNLKKYSPYRHYSGVALSCILLFVTILIAFGLICGICGKRPDSYSDDCCNKGAGSRFLICGVGVMFFFAILLTLAAFVYFVVGVPLYRVACDSLRNPNESQVVEIMDKFLNKPLKEAKINVTISQVLSNCHEEKSIYQVLQLDSVFDLKNVSSNLDNINGSLVQLQDNINYDFNNIELLTENAQNRLNDLIAYGISQVSLDKFSDELKQNFTNILLTDLKDQLDQVIKTLTDQEEPGLNDVITELQTTSLHLQVYQDNLLTPMREHADNLTTLAEELKKSFTINGVILEEALRLLIEQVIDAEAKLKEEGPVILKEIAKNFTNNMLDFAKTFLDRVTGNIQDNVGKCQPLSLVFNATLIATCDRIVQPLNGFWFGIFWSLILFIPAIIFSVKLATLYQKMDPYPGSMVEA